MSEVSAVEEVFATALEKQPDERARYLDSACGENASVRRAVEKLLRAHARMGTFLHRPAAEQYTEIASSGDLTQREGPATNCEDDILACLQPSLRPDSLGRIGHYEILEFLGRGGSGAVFRALDEQLDRVVALKVLSPSLAATSSARRRFLAEARSTAKLRHAHVVQVYSVEEQPLPYLVMELIPGESLQQRLLRAGRFEALEVARIGRQVAEGLAAAHAIGLIHRDVKPDNILLEENTGSPSEPWHARLSDFGLARAADDASTTQLGNIAGTPMYMAPEQALGEVLDHRADLFSLGSVLYTMCCGYAPFRGQTTYAVLRRVVEDTASPIRDAFPETPEWLCDIITRLHAKQPEDRLLSAREVAELLGRHLAPRDPNSHPAEATRHAPGMVPAATPQAAPARAAAGSRGNNYHTRWYRWAAALSLAAILVGGLGFSEASGFTDFHGTVVQLFSPKGTLIVEVGDPAVSVEVAGEDIVITGGGLKEIRLKPGTYTLEAHKDGKLRRRELVSVTNRGRQVVRVILEAPTTPAAPEKSAEVVAWEKSVAKLPANARRDAIRERFKALNPGLEDSSLVDDEGYDVMIDGSALVDLSPIRAQPGIQILFLRGERLVDLSPLIGQPLTRLHLFGSAVSDLAPLRGMDLRQLDVSGCTNISSISVLDGMEIEELTIASTQVSDVTPVASMKLTQLNCDGTRVTDLLPLRGLPLTELHVNNTRVVDLSPLQDMPLVSLNCAHTKVNDDGLVILASCKELKNVLLAGTEVTASGVEGLKRALPACRIEWDGGVLEPQ